LGDEVDLYFCPTLFAEPQRKKEHALETSWLWSDLDSADPRTIDHKPTVAWQTSPGRYQALWRLKRPLPALEASELSRRIAYSEGADKSGWDVTQVLRPPGSLNWKYEPAFRVKLLWSNGPIYNRRSPVETSAPINAQVTAAALEALGLKDVKPNRYRQPPVRLKNKLDTAIWTGDKAILNDAGSVDRSGTLYAISHILARRGLVVEEIARALAERDVSLFAKTSAGPKWVEKPAQYLVLAEQALGATKGQRR
jgi:hypothetical protein